MIVAEWAFFPIAANVMIKARKYGIIMTSWRIFDEDAMMTLSRRWSFLEMLLLAAKRNGVKWAIHGLDRHLPAAVSGMHLLFAVFTDGHAYLKG